MLWLNENREKIKTDNPGIKPTEVAKKGGEMWNKLTDKTEWDEKASIEKAKYAKAMEEYNASGGSAAAAAAAAAKSATSPTVTAEKRKNKTDNSTAGSGTGFKSKEYIESDGSSSGDDKKKSKKVC